MSDSVCWEHPISINVENSSCVNISRYQHKADSFQKASNQQW